jgi:hypothetical protein
MNNSVASEIAAFHMAMEQVVLIQLIMMPSNIHSSLMPPHMGLVIFLFVEGFRANRTDEAKGQILVF